MGRPNLAKSSRRRSAISVAVPTVDRAVRTGFFCSMAMARSEEHTSELQSRLHLVCRLLLEKKKEGHTLAAEAHAQGVAKLARQLVRQNAAIGSKDRASYPAGCERHRQDDRATRCRTDRCRT